MGEWTWRGFKAVQSLVERLPRSWAYALAVLAARVAWLFSPLARPRLERNLKIACPELENDTAALRRLSWLNFQNHAKAYADLMQLPRARVESLQPRLRVKGLDYLEEARAVGKGVLVVSCHMGSYEVVSAIWAATLSPVSFFAEELEPRALFEWYRDTRARLGISALLRQAGADPLGPGGDRAAARHAALPRMRLPIAGRYVRGRRSTARLRQVDRRRTRRPGSHNPGAAPAHRALCPAAPGAVACPAPDLGGHGMTAQ
ncbi:MAG: hypothetical protein E6H99_06990 [Chloroflexi bacterium]|nr:MAG: hypothetical protein E6H99_06990 [Chloroflexota bacterium]